jgi:hypothetical protein
LAGFAFKASPQVLEAVGVVWFTVHGYRGLHKLLDGILHELREIRAPSEGKD